MPEDYENNNAGRFAPRQIWVDPELLSTQEIAPIRPIPPIGFSWHQQFERMQQQWMNQYIGVPYSEAEIHTLSSVGCEVRNSNIAKITPRWPNGYSVAAPYGKEHLSVGRKFTELSDAEMFCYNNRWKYEVVDSFGPVHLSMIE